MLLRERFGTSIAQITAFDIFASRRWPNYAVDPSAFTYDELSECIDEFKAARGGSSRPAFLGDDPYSDPRMPPMMPPGMPPGLPPGMPDPEEFAE